jgi:hypothetical protein
LLKDRLELGSLRRVFCRTYRWAAMTTLTLRRMKDDFIVTGPDIEPIKFKVGVRPRTGARRANRARLLRIGANASEHLSPIAV